MQLPDTRRRQFVFQRLKGVAFCPSSQQRLSKRFPGLPGEARASPGPAGRARESVLINRTLELSMAEILWRFARRTRLHISRGVECNVSRQEGPSQCLAWKGPLPAPFFKTLHPGPPRARRSSRLTRRRGPTPDRGRSGSVWSGAPIHSIQPPIYSIGRQAAPLHPIRRGHPALHGGRRSGRRIPRRRDPVQR